MQLGVKYKKQMQFTRLDEFEEFVLLTLLPYIMRPMTQFLGII